ncbi:hypothetical protein HMPREF9398_1105 [Streptococcus sanguinis VMC66]|nr:hypothetical protein HMPREF9398_1105 [Streptococcus sanguinis VMC66]
MPAFLWDGGLCRHNSAKEYLMKKSVVLTLLTILTLGLFAQRLR